MVPGTTPVWRRETHSTTATRCTTPASTGTAGSPPCPDSPSAAVCDGRQTPQRPLGTRKGCGFTTGFATKSSRQKKRIGVIVDMAGFHPHRRGSSADRGLHRASLQHESPKDSWRCSARHPGHRDPRQGHGVRRPWTSTSTISTRVVDDSLTIHDTPRNLTTRQSPHVPTKFFPTTFHGRDQSTAWSASFEAEASSLPGSTSPHYQWRIRLSRWISAWVGILRSSSPLPGFDSSPPPGTSRSRTTPALAMKPKSGPRSKASKTTSRRTSRANLKARLRNSGCLVH